MKYRNRNGVWNRKAEHSNPRVLLNHPFPDNVLSCTNFPGAWHICATVFSVNAVLLSVITDFGLREHLQLLGLFIFSWLKRISLVYLMFFEICSLTHVSDYSVVQTLPWRHVFRTETLFISMRHAVCIIDLNAQVRQTKQIPGFQGNTHGFLSCHKQKLGI